MSLRHVQTTLIIILIGAAIINFQKSSKVINATAVQWHQSFDELLSQPTPVIKSETLVSGVGLVTTDGMWAENDSNDVSSQDIKIIAFADKHYVSLAKVWYERLSSLGYTEHYIVCVDE